MFSQQIIFGVYHVSQSARPKAFVKYFYFLFLLIRMKDLSFNLFKMT